MSTIKDEIIGIAEEQGYEGEAPKTIAQAVNALGTVIGGGGGGGGGAGIVTHDFTAMEGYQDYYGTDATYSEIFSEVESGNLVIARVHMPASDSKVFNDWITLPLTYASEPTSTGYSSPYTLVFSAIALIVDQLPPASISLHAMSVDGQVVGRLFNQQLKLNS